MIVLNNIETLLIELAHTKSKQLEIKYMGLLLDNYNFKIDYFMGGMHMSYKSKIIVHFNYPVYSFKVLDSKKIYTGMKLLYNK